MSSPNYNGLPIKSVAESVDYLEVEKLIRSGLVEAICGGINPHVKHFTKTETINNQLTHLFERNQDICLYPTQLALESIEKDNEKPYTRLLQSGYGQYEVLFFEVSVLEEYYNNPKYLLYDLGYRGSIYAREEYDEEDMIKDYGMAYHVSFKTTGDLDRAVAVFIHDLAKLSKKSQLKWYSREIDNQNEWEVNGGFIKNLVYGQWIDTIWIYTAFLQEQIVINNMCEAIGINHIFIQTWSGEDYLRVPEGFRTIMFPTIKNYYEFITALEKIACNNISTKAFTEPQFHSKAISQESNEGSIVLLGKWLKTNGMDESAVDDRIVSPLKKVRKIRQIPAHELFRNVYDKTLYKEQNNLIEEVFMSIHALRIMLSRHPLAINVEIPNYLDDLNCIAIY